MKRLLWVAPYLVLLGSASGAADRPATQAADQAPLPVDKLVEEFQTNEVLGKVIAHNLCVLVQAFHELGIDPTFDAGSAPAQKLAAGTAF